MLPSQGCAGPPGILLLQPPKARMTGLHYHASHIALSFFFFLIACSQQHKEKPCMRRHARFSDAMLSGQGACQRSQVSPPALRTHPESPQTPPLRLLYQRQEAGLKPREGTTQTAIISSLAKTSNSPNYPAKEKKTQNENKLTCLHRSCCSNTHRSARTHAHAGVCPGKAELYRLPPPLFLAPTWTKTEVGRPSDHIISTLAGHGLRLSAFGFFYL